MWQRALKNGACPYRGCDIREKVCSHLGRYLSYNPGTYTDSKTKKVKNGRDHRDVDVVYTDDIEHYAHPVQDAPDADDRPGVQHLINKLKRLGFKGYQIQLLLDHHVDKLTFREIVALRGWTSFGAMYWHYKQALKKVREMGIGKFRDA